MTYRNGFDRHSETVEMCVSEIVSTRTSTDEQTEFLESDRAGAPHGDIGELRKTVLLCEVPPGIQLEEIRYLALFSDVLYYAVFAIVTLFLSVFAVLSTRLLYIDLRKNLNKSNGSLRVEMYHRERPSSNPVFYFKANLFQWNIIYLMNKLCVDLYILTKPNWTIEM